MSSMCVKSNPHFHRCNEPFCTVLTYHDFLDMRRLWISRYLIHWVDLSTEGLWILIFGGFCDLIGLIFAEGFQARHDGVIRRT